MLGSWRLWYLVFIVFSCDVLDGTQSIKRDFGSFGSRASIFKKANKEEPWHHGRELEIVDSGPGSKPPKCESKCAKCTPCSPVRVPVQPGPHKASEYYPEAWRCKCKGKLYMP